MTKFFSQKASPSSYATGEPISLVTVCLLSFFLWILIAVLHAVAANLDEANSLAPQSHWHVVVQYICIFLPLALGNCALAGLLWRNSELLLRPWAILLSTLFLVGLGIPFLMANKIVVTLLFEHRPLNLFIVEWHKLSAFIIWVDVCLILAAYFSQAAFASWRRGIIKELEIQLAQNESLDLRLQLLQGQLKPHFLFNALNSISALVRGQDRVLAGKALKQLNALLRYVIHSGKHEWLSVADEIRFVHDYLDMQILRFGNRVNIVFEIEDLDWKSCPCPPLLFQPLVENAIHHGVENHLEASKISILLVQQDGHVHFRIQNPCFGSPNKSTGHGLGIRSTKERLAILYEGRAQVLITQTSQDFQADLIFPAARVGAFTYNKNNHHDENFA